jgi:hypothetical protein
MGQISPKNNQRFAAWSPRFLEQNCPRTAKNVDYFPSVEIGGQHPPRKTFFDDSALFFFQPWQE